MRVGAFRDHFFTSSGSPSTQLLVRSDNPAIVNKPYRASPHGMRHSYVSNLLARGTELNTVSDNQRHALIASTSMYLHGDEIQRAWQMKRALL